VLDLWETHLSNFGKTHFVYRQGARPLGNSFVQLWKISFCFDVAMLARVLFFLVQVPFVNGHGQADPFSCYGDGSLKNYTKNYHACTWQRNPREAEIGEPTR